MCVPSDAAVRMCSGRMSMHSPDINPGNDKPSHARNHFTPPRSELEDELEDQTESHRIEVSHSHNWGETVALVTDTPLSPHTRTHA